MARTDSDSGVLVHQSSSIRCDFFASLSAHSFHHPFSSKLFRKCFFLPYLCFSQTNSLSRGLISLPFFYGFTIFINVFSVLTGAPKSKRWVLSAQSNLTFFLVSKDLTWWMAVLIGLAIGFVVGLIVWFVIVPRLRRKILSILEKLSKHSRISYRIFF